MSKLGFASSRPSPQTMTWNRHSPWWICQVMTRPGYRRGASSPSSVPRLGSPRGPMIAQWFCGITMGSQKYMTLELVKLGAA